MPQPVNAKEYLVEFDEGLDPEATVAALALQRGRVTQRLGARTAVLRIDLPENQVQAALPKGVRLIPAGSAPAVQGPDTLARQAFRHRQSDAFRLAKRQRRHEGREWGTGDLAEPDVHDDDDDDGTSARTRTSPKPVAGQISVMQATLPPPANERLINSVAVGIVIVNGSGDTHISDGEKINIVAEVQEGLSMMANLEPDANISWEFVVKEATVNITPWEGARWPGMPPSFFKGIDAALQRDDNGCIYMFRGAEYVRFSNVSAGVDAGYPKPIAGNWAGLPASFNAGIDAALWRESNGAVYFFKGNQYVRFSKVSDGVDAGYPKTIASSWTGMPTAFNDGIDAALLRKDNGKIYFFKGEQYVRFSSLAGGMDAGYPNPIVGNWAGLPDKFEKAGQFERH